MSFEALRNDVVIWDKSVKDYNGRKRININKKDGLDKDTDVVIMKRTDYDRWMKDYNRLLTMEQAQDNSKITVDSIAEKFITPIESHYKSEISQLKQTVKDKDDEINRLKAVYQDYDKKVYNLGLMDILRHRNKDISDDFNSKIWIIPDSQVSDAEVMELDQSDDQDDG